MAASHYFKKRSPGTPVNLSTGKAIRFEDFGDLGFFVTVDPVIISEFQACMEAGRGGVQVATQLEYEDAVKKKTNLPALRASLFREQQTSGIIDPALIKAVVVSPAAVSTDSNGVIGRAAPVVPAAPPSEPVNHEPRVGKRPAK